MPYTVQTEAARVAIAHRERDCGFERINGQIDARLRELAVTRDRRWTRCLGEASKR